MKIYHRGKQIQLDVKKVGLFGKLIGLMFKSKNTKNLLFEFAPSELSTIHSFFVFFPFLAIWLDNRNNVFETNFVKPFTLAITPKKHPARLIEIPLNSKNRKFFELLVDKETFKYLNR